MSGRFSLIAKSSDDVKKELAQYSQTTREQQQHDAERKRKWAPSRWEGEKYNANGCETTARIKGMRKAGRGRQRVSGRRRGGERKN